MGRWAAFNHICRRINSSSFLHKIPPFSTLKPLSSSSSSSSSSSFSPNSFARFQLFRAFTSSPSSYAAFAVDFDVGSRSFVDFDDDDDIPQSQTANIPVKAFFLSTSINLRSMQAENVGNVVPPTSRNSNCITLRFSRSNPIITKGYMNDVIAHRYMVVFQYGSAVLFNVDDHEVDFFLNIARTHASGVVREMKTDDYTVKENPMLIEDMQGGADYIVLKHLDTDGIRIIGSVLGQSIALDYFVSQVDIMVEEFAGINRGMEKTGTFTMHRKKLFQLVGKANSNLADVILKVGLFDRSEIAWREAKYAQINEYLREEYEVTQRFGNLDIKLKFIEHNIHFLQEVLQNRRSDLLEWCIIVLLSIENVISLYEIVKDTMAGSV